MAEPITEAAFNAARQRAMAQIQAGDPAGLAEAIKTYEWLRAGAPRDPSIQMVLAAELCLAHRLRFEHTRDIADLDAAVACGRDAERGGAGPHFVINLVAALTLRSEITGNLRDLREALRLGEAGLAELPPDDPAYALMLTNHGIAVRVRAELTSDPSQLDEAIARHERIRDTQQGDPRTATVLSLGSLLRVRFDHRGEPADLTRAIEHYREAVALTRPGGPYYAETRNDLGVALRERFETFRDAADIAEAVAVLRQAGGDRPVGEQLLNLGAALDARGEFLNDPASRDEAVDVYRTALATIEPRHTARASLQLNLAQALLGRPSATDDDVAEAVRLGEEAVRASRHPNPLHLSVLAVALRRRADVVAARERTLGNRARVAVLRSRALHLARQAVELSPPDSPGLARLLELDAELTLETSPADHRHAADALERAARSSAAPAPVRMAAARNWANVSMATDDLPAARQATETAVGLLTLIAWPGVARPDRERELIAARPAGPDAGAVALAAADPAAALTLLEQGRALLWSRLLDQRTPLDGVRSAAPGHATRLTEIRRHLDR